MGGYYSTQNENQTFVWDDSLERINNDPIVKLYFTGTKNIGKKYKSKFNEDDDNYDDLKYFFDKAWEEDPLGCLKYIFYLRDYKNGKGQKKPCEILIKHLIDTGRESQIKDNMKFIPKFGTWKDISRCFFGTTLEGAAIKLIAEQLKADLQSDDPSLCAKFSPSEGSAVDKKFSASAKISKSLGVRKVVYRKQYLVPLRNKLNIVEQKMCSKEWDKVDYDNVPSVANSKYKRAFLVHDYERYMEYQAQYKSKQKAIMPHQIVNLYLKNISHANDESTQLQWKDLIDSLTLSGTVLPLLSTVNNISIALTLLFSIKNTTFPYKYIHYNSEPELVSLTGTSLKEQINSIVNRGFIKDAKIDYTKIYNVLFDQPSIPNRLFILSNRPFEFTEHETISKKYHDAGKKLPHVIHWNLSKSSNHNYISYHEPTQTLLLNGQHDEYLPAILQEKLPNLKQIIKNILDSDTYSCITSPNSS